MGMPSINITFTELAKTVMNRSGAKTVGLIIPMDGSGKSLKIAPGDVVPEEVEEYKEQIDLALLGGTEKPKKVIVTFAGSDFTNLDNAFNILADEEVHYIALAGSADESYEKVIAWIKEQRTLGKPVKAVLAKNAADNEAIINYATESVETGGKSFTAEQYCGRIAGLLAGTPITEASTYCILPEATDCSRLTQKEMDAAVDGGKFIVFYTSGEIRVGRGINSLTTTNDVKGKQHKKIKIVDIMDTIRSDITNTVRNDWIGKKANTYDNKCLLISAIQNYMDELIAQTVLTRAVVEIDVEGNKKYLEKEGIDTTEMSMDEMKQANTGEQIFLKATIQIIDAIEDITVEITV